MKTLFLIALLSVSTNAHAYLVSALSPGGDAQAIDPNQTTHLFVVGYSHGVGNQFLAAAKTRALKTLELYPDHQMILIRNRETGTQADLNEVRGMGFKVFTANADTLNGPSFLKIASLFQKIASIEIYSHSSTHAGLGLEGEDERLRTDTPNLSALKSHFTKDAYVTLNGCNSGFYTAPAFSKAWGVPVAGSFTSTDFQQLYSDGTWYFNNQGQYPHSGGWASQNTESFESQRSCESGDCHRMKPDNAAYSGMWGEFQAGLGFYKFFCADGLDTDHCKAVMARALYASISTRPLKRGSSMDDFRKVAQDLLCPNRVNSMVRAECVKALEDSETTLNPVYSSFDGNPVECTFSSCTFSFECKNDSDGDPIPGSCVIKAPRNLSPRTQVYEYWRYLQGFQLLQATGGV